MKIAAMLFAGTLMLGAAESPRTFTGVITDTMCGADHAAMGVTPDAKCVRECVKHDKKYKYALLDGKNMYVLSDQQTPEQFAGRKVKITGVLYEKTKILKTNSIVPLDAGSSGTAPTLSGHTAHSH